MTLAPDTVDAVANFIAAHTGVDRAVVIEWFAIQKLDLLRYLLSAGLGVAWGARRRLLARLKTLRHRPSPTNERQPKPTRRPRPHDKTPTLPF